MTQEEKAKAYDEALSRAKNLHKDAIDMGENIRAKQCEIIFPELKESEDELTWLTRYIEEESYNLSIDIRDDVDRIKLKNLEKSLAWLKEQGKKEEPQVYETKNNEVVKYSESEGYKVVESKFHEGDWVIDNQGLVHQIEKVVENVTNHTFGYDIVGGGYFNDNSDIRLWTIQDAKEGDVLVDKYNNIGIFQKCIGICWHSYIYFGYDGKFLGHKGGSHEQTDTHPVTKEQRDILMKAITDSGFTFDFDKKESKEIEDEEYDGEDYGIDSLWHAKNILEKTLGKVEGYQTDDGILEHKCAISAVDKLYKQKPAV